MREEVLGLARESVHTEMAQEPMERLVTLAKALSDPTRVRMVYLLAQGRTRSGLPDVQSLQVPGADGTDGICVNELQEYFQLGQSKVSYHLRILKDAGVVVEEGRGKWSFYTVNRRALREMTVLLEGEFQL